MKEARYKKSRSIYFITRNVQDPQIHRNRLQEREQECLVPKGRISLMADQSVLELDRGVIAHHWKNTIGYWKYVCTDFFLSYILSIFKKQITCAPLSILFYFIY